MNNKYLVYMVAFLELLMQQLLYSTLAVMLGFGFFYTENSNFFKCMIVGLVIPTFFYLCRKKLKNKVVYIIIYVAAFLGIMSMTNVLEERITYIVVGLIVIACSFLLTIDSQDRIMERPPVGFIALFIACIIVGDYAHSDMVSDYAKVCGMIFIIVQILYHNLFNEKNFISINSETANLPVSQMIKVNGVMMGIFTLISVGMLFIMDTTAVKKMIWAIGEAIRLFLVWIFSFRDDEPVETVKQTVMETTQEASSGDMMLPPAETGILTDIFNGIFVILGVILLILLIISIGVAIVRTVKLISGGDSLDGDIKEFIDIKQNASFFSSRRREKKEKELSTTNQKARKYFKNGIMRIVRKNKQTIKMNRTPSEMVEEYCQLQKNDLVVSIYEKARYSQIEISQEELSEIKSAFSLSYKV